MDVNEKQIGGAHYAGKFQHWDFVMQYLGGRYLEGQVTRYLSRWRKKNGDEDLEKSLHYLEKMLSEIKEGRCKPFTFKEANTGVRGAELLRDSYQLDPLTYRATSLVSSWQDLGALLSARTLIFQLLREERGLPPE